MNEAVQSRKESNKQNFDSHGNSGELWRTLGIWKSAWISVVTMGDVDLTFALLFASYALVFFFFSSLCFFLHVRQASVTAAAHTV